MMDSRAVLTERLPPTRTRVAVFAITVVAVPILALSLLVYDIATDTRGAFLNAGVPAIVGAALGILMIGLRSIRSARIRKGGKGEKVALCAVPVAAVVAGVGNDLPRWFGAGMEGWVTGFFLAMTFFLLRLWRQDPEFRKSIKVIASSRS
jgi:uncharacterized membrane protein